MFNRMMVAVLAFLLSSCGEAPQENDSATPKTIEATVSVSGGLIAGSISEDGLKQSRT